MPTEELILNLITIYLILGLYSFVFKDNIHYRLVLGVYVGSIAGWSLALQYEYIVRTMSSALSKGQVYYILALILGLMLFFKFSKRHLWVYRIPIAYLVGLGVALSIRAIVSTQFLQQIQATILPIWTPDPWTNINNLIFIIMVISSLWFFTFHFEHKGVSEKIARIGRYTLIAAFGAGFGNTVMFRMSLITGRFRFLLSPNNRIYTVIIALILIVSVAVYEQYIKKK
ncbi:MAG: hypothetical protein NDF54_01440 [archaeon GB-1867-035]|nr:hypothetical protein [Candidatus Culexmicrobium profundum]